MFFPSLHGEYLSTCDDNLQILYNSDVLNISWQSIKNYFTSFYVHSYQPIASLSFGLEYYFFGNNPLIPHITNLVLHLLNIFVVFFLLNKITAQFKALNIFILAVFALHPLQGELLGWISTRSTLIANFFVLISCLYSIQYITVKNRSYKYLWFSLLLFVLSLLSKSSVIVLPIVLLSFDYLYKRKL